MSSGPHGTSCVRAPTRRDLPVLILPHNPTVVDEIALVTWHGVGLVAASLMRGRLSEAAAFEPRPLERVATEDPRLTAGPVKVAMWSTPIVADGLIYVVDVRNGLYSLRGTGRRRDRTDAPRGGELERGGVTRRRRVWAVRQERRGSPENPRADTGEGGVVTIKQRILTAVAGTALVLTTLPSAASAPQMT